MLACLEMIQLGILGEHKESIITAIGMRYFIATHP